MLSLNFTKKKKQREKTKQQKFDFKKNSISVNE